MHVLRIDHHLCPQVAGGGGWCTRREGATVTHTLLESGDDRGREAKGSDGGQGGAEWKEKGIVGTAGNPTKSQ
jgi:hypothetical protein